MTVGFGPNIDIGTMSDPSLVLVRYLSEGYQDRGISIKDIIKERDPVAIDNPKGQVRTRLSDGVQRPIFSKNYMPDRNEEDIGGLFRGRMEYHTVYFRSIGSALYFMRQNHPEIKLGSANDY